MEIKTTLKIKLWKLRQTSCLKKYGGLDLKTFSILDSSFKGRRHLLLKDSVPTVVQSQLRNYAPSRQSFCFYKISKEACRSPLKHIGF